MGESIICAAAAVTSVSGCEAGVRPQSGNEYGSGPEKKANFFRGLVVNCSTAKTLLMRRFGIPCGTQERSNKVGPFRDLASGRHQNAAPFQKRKRVDNLCKKTREEQKPENRTANGIRLTSSFPTGDDIRMPSTTSYLLLL